MSSLNNLSPLEKSLIDVGNCNWRWNSLGADGSIVKRPFVGLACGAIRVISCGTVDIKLQNRLAAPSGYMAVASKMAEAMKTPSEDFRPMSGEIIRKASENLNAWAKMHKLSLLAIPEASVVGDESNNAAVSANKEELKAENPPAIPPAIQPESSAASSTVSADAAPRVQRAARKKLSAAEKRVRETKLLQENAKSMAKFPASSRRSGRT